MSTASRAMGRSFPESVGLEMGLEVLVCDGGRKIFRLNMAD